MNKLKLVWLFLLTVSCVGNLIAQQQLSECKDYNQADFKAGTVTFNVVKADLRDILNYITEVYGCNFIIDKSVKTEPITVKFDDVPWNIALDSILKFQKLNIQSSGSILRVAYKKQLDEEAMMNIKSCPTLEDKPFVTEFIKLKNITTQTLFYDDNLLKIIRRRLTKNGSVEVDEHSNTLKITDKFENLKAIISLIDILDVEGDWKESLERSIKLKTVTLPKSN